MHKPSNKDERLLVEAKEAMRSLVSPTREYKYAFTGFDGRFIGKYSSLAQFTAASSVIVTVDQINPTKSFETNNYIHDEKHVWESYYRRCIFTRNGTLGPGYLEIWSEDNHGKWDEIEEGLLNPARLTEEDIKLWRGMEKRERGGQSTGRVYELDDKRNRKVIRIEKSWFKFGFSKIKVDQVTAGRRAGSEIRGRIFVHETQSSGEERRYEVGEILPVKAPAT